MKAIKAKAYSDDLYVEIEFDAIRWFEQASDTEILELSKCGFGGDYPADDVAKFYEKNETKEIFEHIKHVDYGFECYVDEDDVAKWLEENRPILFRAISFNQ